MEIKTTSKTLRVFETFAGIGAQHKALRQIYKMFGFDYKIVGISEWDIYSNISYNAIHNKFNEINVSEKQIDQFLKKYNHSIDGKNLYDIQKVLKLDFKIKNKLYQSYINNNNLGSIKDITGKNLIDTTKAIDLITYSFPCQDLSIAGSLHGFNKGMEKGSNTRSSLLWEIERILFELKELNKLPKFLLMENVKNMLSEKHKKQYYEFLKSLNSLGYSTKTYLLNAKDYGIPQNRERVYALSVLDYKGLVNDNGEILDLLDCPEQIHQNKALKDILKLDYSNYVYYCEATECIPNNTPSRRKIYQLSKKLNDFKNIHYTRTLTTKQDRNPCAGVIEIKNTKIEIANKSNYRFITPREAFLLMGFDEIDFEKVKEQSIRKEKLYQQAGNSIVVNAIAPIMLVIQKLFNSQYENN